MKQLLLTLTIVLGLSAMTLFAGPVNPHPNQTLVSETPSWTMVIAITGTDSGTEYIFQWSQDGVTWTDSSDGQTFQGGTGAVGHLVAPYPWESIKTRAVPFTGGE